MKIDEFLKAYKENPVVDVRSPIEYEKGHVPGSINIPLFTNEERAAIGTLYKEKGQEEAIVLGESYANPKIDFYIDSVRQAAGSSPVIVYCFRGGLRSRRFCLLLEEHKIPHFRLEGGYKAFRKAIRDFFQQPLSLKVVGGRTGTGKTDILAALDKEGEAVVDLEGLSCHRGSAFGAIGMPDQPSTEHFENLLYDRIESLGNEKPIWVEDESRNIGSVFLPESFYQALRISPLYILSIPHEERIRRLCRDYTGCGEEPLLASLEKIRKRLGGERTNKAADALKSGHIEEAVDIILQYYDRCYDYGVSDAGRNIKVNLQLPEDNPLEAARKLISS